MMGTEGLFPEGDPPHAARGTPSATGGVIHNSCCTTMAEATSTALYTLEHLSVPSEALRSSGHKMETLEGIPFPQT